MDVSLQKRLAAEIYKVGLDRVKIDPEKLEEVSKALTREDVRILVEKGIIEILPKKGQSRVWARIRHEQRKKGRQRGYGSRKGKKGARLNKKEQWMLKIRALRKLLRILRDKNVIDKKLYRRLYRMSKGGFFRSRRHLLTYLKDRGLIE